MLFKKSFLSVQGHFSAAMFHGVGEGRSQGSFVDRRCWCYIPRWITVIYECGAYEVRESHRVDWIMYKILRRGSGRVFVLGVVVLSLLLCLYYVSQVQAPPSSSSSSSGHPAAAAAAILNEELRYDRSSLTSVTPDYSELPDARVSLATCPIIVPRNVDIDAQQEFSKFDFQVSPLHLSVFWKTSAFLSRIFTLFLSFSFFVHIVFWKIYFSIHGVDI